MVRLSSFRRLLRYAVKSSIRDVSLSGVKLRRQRRRSRIFSSSQPELLENRLLLAAYTWQGGFDNNVWNSARNWLNVDLGETNQGIPGSDDTATLAAGHFLNLNANVTVGQLIIEDSAADFQVDTHSYTLTVNGGRLEGGNLFGTYVNDGSLVIDVPPTATDNWNGALRLLGSLTNNATLDMQGGVFVTSYYLSGNATIINSAGGTIEMSDTARLEAQWGQPYLINSGVIRKTGGPGMALISSTIQSQIGSRIEVEEGTLRLAGFAQEIRGPIDIQPGSTLETFLPGVNEMRLTDDLTLTGGGEWKHARGIVRLNGHTIQSTDTTLRVDANAAESSSVARILDHGTLDLQDFHLERGYLGHAGFGTTPLGSVVTNVGNVFISPGEDLDAWIAGATLVNEGQVVVDNATAAGFNIEGGALNNQTGGTLTFSRHAWIQGAFPNGVGPSFIRNAGLIVSDVPAGDSVTWNDMVFQAGPGSVLDVRSGTLNLARLRHWSLNAGFESHLTGSHFIVAPDATLDLMPAGRGYNSAPRLSGRYTAEGGGRILLGQNWWDDAEIAFPEGMAEWGPYLFYGRVTNTGFLSTGTSLSGARDIWGELRNAGTLTVNGGNAINLGPLFVGPGLLTNLPTGVVQFPAGGQILGIPGTLLNANTPPLIVNEGRIEAPPGINIVPRLDNFGTIETAGPATVHNPRALRLAGAHQFGLPGEWIARDGGGFNFTNPSIFFDSIDGRVALIGSGSSFTGLSDLTRIRGELSLIDDASFTISQPLTNEGRIELDAGSHLTVNGSYTQTVRGQLTTLVGGTTDFGRMSVAGTATLNGTLVTGLANNFEPLAADRFNVVTATAVSGEFDDVREHGLAAAVSVTNVTLGLADLAVDLLVENVSVSGVSGPLLPGSTFQVQYTVRNLASREAIGPWTDLFYLSTDSRVTPDDHRLERSGATLSLPAFGSVTLTETVTVPDRPGSWFVLAAADASGVVLDINRNNNVAAAPIAVIIAATPLPFGVDVPSDVPAGQPVHYQLQIPPGSTSIRVSSTFPYFDAGEIRIRRGNLPDDSSEALIAASRPVGAGREATLLLDRPEAGTWFVSVLSRTAGVAVTRADNLSSTLSLTGFLNESSLSSQLIAGDSLTLTVEGTGFTPSTQFRLGARNADSTTLLSSSQAVVTFGNLTVGGPLNISASEGGTPVIYSAKAFTVVAADSSAAAAWAALPNWGIEVNMPEITRPFREIPVIVTFRNQSSRSQPAPLIQLLTDNGSFRFDGATTWSPDYALVLGVKDTGRTDLYAPGESGIVKLFVSPRENGGHVFTNVAAAAVTEKSVSSVIGLGGSNFPQETDLPLAAEFVDALRPGTISTEAWNSAVRPALMQIFGNTVASWASAMRRAGNVLATDGAVLHDPARALAWLVQMANQFGAVSDRFTLTAYGRGMEDPFDIRAVAHASGNIDIHSGFTVRPFRRAGVNFIATEGDRGRLTTRPGGGWLLTEADGRMTAFAADGRWEYFTDILGQQTTAGYVGNQLTTITDPFGDVTTFAWNAGNLIESRTDAVGRITTFTYDAQQRLTAITEPLGTTLIEWNADTTGPLAWTHAALTAPNGIREAYTYNALGRLIRREYNAGEEATDIAWGSGSSLGELTITDSLGRQAEILIGELGQATFIRDAAGRVIDPRYDFYGRIATLDLVDQRVVMQRDKFGNIVRSTSPAGHDIRFDYDANGITTESLVDPLGRLTDFVNGDRTLLTAQVNPDGRSQLYGYDAAGNSVFRRSTGGRWVLDTVNSKNLVIRRDFSDGSRLDFAYDARRNLTTVTETPASGAPRTVTMTFDAADRVTRVSYPGGRFIDYRYDAFNRHDRITTSDGLTIDYTFDTLGRLLTVARNGNVEVTYAWDSIGRLTSKSFANGSVTTYAYDALDRMSRIEHRDAGNTLFSFQEYTRDAQDRVTSMTDASGVTLYSYDPDGQLIQVRRPDGSIKDYAVDAVGNRTAYTINELNQYLTGPGGETFQYDRDGNLEAVVRADGSMISYGYDGRNRLVSISEPGNMRQFEYDPLGNRSAVIINGVRTDLLIDALGGFDGLSDVIAEYNGATQIASYVLGEGLDAAFTGTGAGRYFHFDLTGNTTALTSADSSVVASYAYLPFGEILSATGPAAAGNRFTFNGQWGVAQYGTNSFDMRARLYDSATGRFTQQDPIGFYGRDVNVYRFVKGDPISYVDSSGLNRFKIGRGRRKVEAPTPGHGATGGNNLPPKHNQRNSGGGDGGGGRGGHNDPDGNGEEIVKPGSQGEHTTFSEAVGEEIISEGASLLLEAIGGTTAATTATVFGLVARPLGAEVEFPPQHFKRKKLIETQSKLHPKFREEMEKYKQETGRTDLQFEELMEVLQRVRQRESKKRRSEQLVPNDPNEIVGPAGAGSPGFLNTPAVFPYTIYFQNMPTAAAPAQEVFVTQTLDPDLDWDTLELTGFGWADVQQSVSPGLRSHRTHVTDPASGLLVEVDVTFNAVSGELVWTFRSLDPVTLDLPWDGLAGFLPPDDETGRGQGYVSYIIQPKMDAAEGTQYTGQASIVFDTEAPIITNTWLNTVDNESPSSSVQALPAIVNSTSFMVSWSGNDGSGSGISVYDIFVSENGGPYTLWMQNTSATSAQFTGLNGRTYRFFSIATDHTGNVENVPGIEDTVTGIDLPSGFTSPPASTVDLAPVISWDAVPEAASYEIWIANISTGVNPFHQGTTITNSYTPPGPLGIGRYRVWRRSFDAAGVPSTWSPQYTFRISAPVAVQPMQRFQTDATPDVSWSPLPGAASYELWIDNRSTGQSKFVYEPSMTTTSWTADNSWPLGVYRIWLRGRDGGNIVTGWFGFQEIVIVTPPEIIRPTTPTFDRRPELSWHPVVGAVSYDLRLVNAGTGVVTLIPGMTTTSWTPPASLPDGLHRWQVLATSAEGVRSYWSPLQEVFIGGRPSILSISDPSGGLPQIAWTAVDGATSYSIWIDRIGAQAGYIQVQGHGQAAYLPPVPLPGGTYRVWIRAVSSLGENSPWSLMQQFTVASAEDPSLLPEAERPLFASLQDLPGSLDLNAASKQPADGSASRGRSTAETTSGADDENTKWLPDPAAHSAPKTRPQEIAAQHALIANHMEIINSSDLFEADTDLIDLLMSHEVPFLN